MEKITLITSGGSSSGGGGIYIYTRGWPEFKANIAHLSATSREEEAPGNEKRKKWRRRKEEGQSIVKKKDKRASEEFRGDCALEFDRPDDKSF